ncbi:MAG: hypothetical protein U1F67_04490 [Rubrivivax sp.]
MVLLVDPDADRHAEHPVVGQRLGPQRVDLEAWRIDRRALLRMGEVVEPGLAGAERRQRQAGRGNDEPRVENFMTVSPPMALRMRLRVALFVVSRVRG